MHRLYRVVFLTLVTVVGVVVGYGQYRLQLPNGERVSHPCKPNFIWRGVGHNGTRGGGTRNKFGLDFAAHGYKWTSTLCQLDSDGDKVTNGMELGDPNCIWRPGQIPDRTDDITHPDPLRTEPYECDMDAGGECINQIGGWSLGEPGDCLDYKFGMLFGKSKYKRIALEYHWNNPKKVADWYDESGVSIYYTNNLRPNNGAVLTVGQTYLSIPPGRTSTKFTATCSPTCTTTALKNPIFVTGASNHMHYLGISQSVEQLRNGSRLRYLTKEDSYSYDDPQFFEFKSPIEVRPGDELLTTCEFKSTTSRNWVYYGDSTSDEMCFAFMTFYPAESMQIPYCNNYKSIEICMGENKPLVVADCKVFEFLLISSNVSYPIYLDVAVNCFAGCTVECKAAVARAREHPCLRGGDITEYVERFLKLDREGRNFLQALEDCGTERTTVTVSDNGSRAVGLFTHQSLYLIMETMYLIMGVLLLH